MIYLGFKQFKILKYFTDFAVAPVIGVILLVVTASANLDTIINGILGFGGTKPYNIIILFMSLAYICISLDQTGFFEYLALIVSKRAGTSGLKLFFYIYLLAGFITIFTSNDIVILTLTPIIIYMAKYTKINPVPYILAQFFAANIWSTFLYIENPTNIIVAQAYNLSFLGFFSWMAIPTITGAMTAFLVLWLYFRKQIPKLVTPLNSNSRLALRDRTGAIYTSIVLIVCLTLLSITVEFAWLFALSCAIACFVRDLGYDIYKYKTGSNEQHKIVQPSTIDEIIVQNHEQENVRAKRFKKVRYIVTRMPWKIIPFVAGMFIIIGALFETGWIEVFANGISYLMPNAYASILTMTFISSLSANLFNNQPMTILFTEIMLNINTLNPAILPYVPYDAAFGSMFAVIMGSNYGACFTFIGALAGIMWKNIVSNLNVQIGFKQFAKLGFVVMPFVIFTACTVLTLEIILFPGLIPVLAP